MKGAITDRLIQCIEWEEQEQAQRFRLDQAHSLKQLKAEGLALHPLRVTRKNFGFADYPEISFRLPFPAEQSLFKDGAAIECFYTGEEPIKGVLLGFDGKAGEFRLYAPDFPDWIEEEGMGIKLAPDTRTTTLMKEGLRAVGKHKTLFPLFERLHQGHIGTALQSDRSPLQWASAGLNPSQQEAVRAILGNEELMIVHGPPGTGKTTTLVEGVVQLTRRGHRVLVSAPSNTAVDHLSKGLLKAGVRVLRVGNTSKVDEEIYPHTPEGKMAGSRALKDIKELKKRAEEFRRMALKYKRSFGKAEREQRNLLFKEVKSIRAEIRKLEQYEESRFFEEAQVIAGTPVGLCDAGLGAATFHTLVIDEAGQCLEPLAWCIFPFAERYVLAGDPYQLPPTVLSAEAARAGFNQSLLEVAMQGKQEDPSVFLLNVQYRMRPQIAGFSSAFFYGGKLMHGPGRIDEGVHLSFVDTAGSGYQEEQGKEGVSLRNEGELRIVKRILEEEAGRPLAVISPYSGQVSSAREQLPASYRISTIDSFQGQEQDIIVVSLVRSNDEGEIGFLKDYRRMNVALTRAREKLIIIGDSATLGTDPFYQALLAYVEKCGTYRSVWEFEWDD